MMICLDQDGLLSDLWSSVLRYNGEDPQAVMERWPRGEYSFAKVLGKPESKIWGNVHAAGYDFWTQLPELPYAAPLVDLALSLCEVRVVTKPVDSYFCTAGKHIWLQNHFGGRLGTADRFHITAAKADLARPDRLLIDDSDENCKAWRAAGGEAILYPQPWNAGHWSVLSEYGRWCWLQAEIQAWHAREKSKMVDQVISARQYGPSTMQPACRALMQLEQIEKSVGRVIADVKALGVELANR